VEVYLPDRETLNRLNDLARISGGSAARIAGAAIRKCLQEPIFEEMFREYAHDKVTRLPGLPKEILGELYPQVRDLSLRGGMLASELILAVLWTQLFRAKDLRAVIRSKKWFLRRARKIVRSITRGTTNPELPSSASKKGRLREES
jgi:hypothetical protein